MTAPKRKPARMKPAERDALVYRGRLMGVLGAPGMIMPRAGERIARVRIVEIAAPKKRSRK